MTQRQGFLVIDRLIGGLSGGGTRMREGCSLDEVERLARGMSLKNGTLGVGVGGAKCGIDIDPRDPDAYPILVRFIRMMRAVFETYMGTGEDMGTSQALLQRAFRDAGLESPLIASLNKSHDRQATVVRVRVALDLADDGIPLVDCVGGFGVAEAAEAGLHELGIPIRGARVAIQGFGSMGGSSARYLKRKGARVIAVADVHGCVANPDGLDIDALLAGRDEHGGIDRSTLRRADAQLARDEWLSQAAEVLVPAAIADTFHEGNCDLVSAPLVVEAANIPTTEGASRRLAERGNLVIPDFVANAGTNAWFWWLLLGEIEPTIEAAFARISTTMRNTVGTVLERARERGLLPREAAEELALRQLDVLSEEAGEKPA